MTTSTLELTRRLRQIIKSNPHLNGQRLRIVSNQGRVILEGEVFSYYQKQMAQESIRQIDGVERIENHLKVRWPETAELAATD